MPTIFKRQKFKYYEFDREQHVAKVSLLQKLHIFIFKRTFTLTITLSVIVIRVVSVDINVGCKAKEP